MVLMADDDPEDCLPAAEAFLETGAEAAFFCVLDGIELMNHLTEHLLRGKRTPSPILPDLNMPRKDGWHALIEIKAEPALKHIPIVILTTSADQKILIRQVRRTKMIRI
jgi:CheY-like chemotaxis protein